MFIEQGSPLDLSFVEVNANCKFTDAFAIRAGRFNTPVSPSNYYFYAPMNTGVALPMQSTHHNYYPQSVDGIDFNGSINTGNNSTLKYNIFGGGYFQVEHLPIGILRFHGRENAFLLEKSGQQVEQFGAGNIKLHYYPGAGGRLNFEIGDFLTIGANTFIMKKNIDVYKMTEDTLYLQDTLFEGIQQSFGGNIKLNIGNLTIPSEYWTTIISPDDTDFESLSFFGYYGELTYSFGKITPFIKYEFIKHDMNIIQQANLELDIKRSTIGINYRPIFETMFKLEYHRYITTLLDFDAVLFSLVYSF